MTIIEIKHRESLRVGDIATLAFEGHEFTGPLWERSTGILLIGSSPVRHANGRWFADYTFVSATREVPDLPTEPGAVIYVTDVRGKVVHGGPNPAMLGDGGEWMLTYAVDGDGTLDPSEITGWRPAKMALA